MVSMAHLRQNSPRMRAEDIAAHRANCERFGFATGCLTFQLTGNTPPGRRLLLARQLPSNFAAIFLQRLVNDFDPGGVCDERTTILDMDRDFR